MDWAATNICFILPPSHSVWYLKQAGTENFSFKGPLYSLHVFTNNSLIKIIENI